MALLSRLKNIGPGMLVAAAFIGPGTITTATLAGAQFGYSLLWCVVFSTIATIILQLMTVRIGVVARLGVGEALRLKTGHSRILRFLITFLVFAAILIGNSAYEAGNITGAILGISSLINKNILVILVTAGSAVLLYSGNYKIIEKVLITLVALMGIVFLAASVALNPNFLAILKSISIPSLPDNSELLVMGLIGTTIVPYNLFLHATSVKKKWATTKGLKNAKLDAILSIALGGLITMAVVICAASAFEGQSKEISGMNDLATQLEPILGSWADDFLSLGFLAAGLSSTIAAPLAAAYALTEIAGKQVNLKDKSFKAIWLLVMLSGGIVALLDYTPTLIILFAQVANGFILPIAVAFLLWTANDKKLMRGHSNSILDNILGSIIFIITIGIGAKGVLSAFGLI